jgi:leader peptidase (prepilin peptidase)/N-methyltransferase
MGMVIAVIVLIWLGLAFGSFINALVWRVHEQSKNKAQKTKHKKQSVANKNLSIITGRSQCVHCGHILGWKDLIPVFSWLYLKGKCRYCGKPISWQYPVVELALAFVFVGSYIWWPGGVHGAGDWVLFITWLLTSVGLMALLVYDARWMILPNRIIYPTLLIAVAGRLVYLVGFEANKPRQLAAWFLSLLVASGIFWVLFIVSRGRLIGYGDVRLGWITGTVLARPAESFLMIVIASLMGTLFVLPDLITGKKSAASKLPYGPFLIVATFAVLIFGSDFMNWYTHLFLPNR